MESCEFHDRFEFRYHEDDNSSRLLEASREFGRATRVEKKKNWQFWRIVWQKMVDAFPLTPDPPCYSSHFRYSYMYIYNLHILFDMHGRSHAHTYTNIYFYTWSIVGNDSSKHRYKLMRHIQTTSLATTIIRPQVYVKNRTTRNDIIFFNDRWLPSLERPIRWICSYFTCPLCHFPPTFNHLSGICTNDGNVLDSGSCSFVIIVRCLFNFSLVVFAVRSRPTKWRRS